MPNVGACHKRCFAFPVTTVTLPEIEDMSRNSVYACDTIN